MAEHRVLIGACGWEHPGWTGRFYPEDLPADWRLSYYANLYRVALVGPAEWGRGTPADWAADTGPDFRLLGELPASLVARAVAGRVAPLAAWLEAWSALGDRAAGLILPESAAALPADMLARLAATGPVAWAGPEAPPPGLGAARVWPGPPAPPELEEGGLAVARLAPPAQGLRAVRAALEVLLGAADRGRRAVLLVDGAPPDPQVLESAATLLDLL